MKKVLSFVLVLSMILGSFGMAFAAAPSDVVGKDYEDAVNVLMELGVVDGYKDGTYRPEKVVTRAEMATLIIKALGLNDYAVGKSGFSDMAGHWADAYVAYAASLGFISGYGDGTFRPNQTVTYDQAITMVVQALGYKGEYLVGGYPGAFVAQAKTLGMLDGIKSGVAGANRGDIATLLFNTLPVSFVRYDKNGSLENIVLKGDKNDTMMQRLGASLYNPTEKEGDAGKAFVVTGNEKSVINLKEYQGAYVTAYVNKDGKIIAIEEVKSEFITGDITKKNNNLIITLADDTEYKLDRVEGKNVLNFVNGELVTKEDENGKIVPAESKLKVANDVTLAVELSGKYVDTLYSISTWTEKETIQWDEDYAEALDEDHAINKSSFVETDDEEIDMDELVLVGVASLKDIKEDDVVTYYVNGSNEIVKVEVSSTVVTGKVTKADDADKATEVTIGGKKYDVAKGYATIKLGDEGKFFLNYAGDIAFVDVTTTEANDYAVVLVENGYDTKAFGEDAIMKIKLLTADDKKTVFVIEEDCADKLGNGEAVTKKFGKGVVVAYNVDKNGEIDKIEKVAEKEKFEFVETIKGKLTSKGYLDGHKVADEVVVFTVETKENNVKEYSVGKLSDVKTNKAFSEGSQYYLNADGEVVVIVLDVADSANDDDVYGVVVSKTQVKNDDDKTVWEINMLVDGKEVTYLGTTALDMDKVPAGVDLLKIEFDGSEVKTLTKADVATTDGAVQAIKDGNLKIKDAYVEVSADVVVYLYNKDDKEFELSKFSAISKKDTVTLYELDGKDDENGYDVIIFTEN